VIRTFLEWKKSLPLDIVEKYFQNDKKVPKLNHVNYIWITNLIDNSSEKLSPTIDELLDWVKTGQVNAKN
jgi:hypothetical protein